MLVDETSLSIFNITISTAIIDASPDQFPSSNTEKKKKKTMNHLFTCSTMVEEQGVPVIDMGDFPQQSKKLLKACEEWGCFRIINHRISIELMSEMRSVVRSLFDLPMEIKWRNTDVISEPGCGYYASTKMDPIHEGLGFYDIANPDAVEAFCDQLDASPHQREVIKSYSGALHELVMEIGAKLGESMGLGGNFAKEWPCRFRFNMYNFTKETIGSSGLQIHTDTGFLTILQLDECVGELEVMNKSGDEFIAVDPSPGSLIIILGDIATAWSNGRLRNVKHRVECKQASTRLSIVLFFMGAPVDEAMEAPPEFIDSDHPRLYAPFTYKDYRKLTLSTGLRGGESLELVRLTTSP